MAESAAVQDTSQEVAERAAPRERLALGAFVFASVAATLAWLALLGWLMLLGLRALGV